MAVPTSTRFRMLLAVVASLALLVAAGCSDDDEAGGSSGSSTTTADGSAEPSDNPTTEPEVPEVVPSSGCEGVANPTTTDSTTPAAPTASTPDDEPERIDLAAGPRPGWYLLSVPADDAEPQPLVLDLHGYLEGAEPHVGHSQLGALGQQEGFVVVTPQGTGERPFWNFRQQEAGPPDVGFLTAVLDEVEADLCIDRRRVFVTGLSNGAFMTSTLGCELTDRVAAIAPVAGVRFEEGCEPSRPLPVLAFHGTEDTFVAYAPDPPPEETASTTTTAPPDGEFDDRDNFNGFVQRPVVDWLGRWAEANGCSGGPAEEAIGTDVDHLSWEGCPEGAEVELFRVEGGGHSWPGSDFSKAIERVVGKTTFEIDATEEMWAFFERHPLPTAPPEA